MGTANRALATVLLVAFGLPLVFRPLSNPVFLDRFGDGAAGLGSLTLVVLGGGAVLFVLVRLGSLQHEDVSDSDRTPPEAEWNTAPEATVSWDRVADEPHDSDPAGDQRDDTGGESGATAPAFLGGQGGAREKGFEIETRQPDASLRDHLDHLRAELDDPDSRRELDRLEEVVAETEDGTELPSRCPEQHCDAAWSERGIVGARTGRYERLDDDRVLCLECETVHTID